jgi:hypothetical protein
LDEHRCCLSYAFIHLYSWIFYRADPTGMLESEN